MVNCLSLNLVNGDNRLHEKVSFFFSTSACFSFSLLACLPVGLLVCLFETVFFGRFG